MSRHWLFLITFFFIVVCSHKRVWIGFSRDKKSLSGCIENYLLHTDYYYYKEAKTRDIADLIAFRFFHTSKRRNLFLKRINHVWTYLKTTGKDLFKDNEVYEPLLYQMREALEKCADDESNVPIFNNEPRELANVLDFILVDWPMSVQDMIRTKEGLALLRRYARDALISFETALSYIKDHENFRNQIRKLWIRRARLYYDSRDTEFPYIFYTYTNKRGLRTYGNVNFFSTRSEVNFLLRNPPLQLSIVNDFLYIHKADRPPYVDNDIFAEYSTWNRMSRADLYIETHIDRFYRTLYFVHELEISANVASPEVEIAPIPEEGFRNGIDKILCNDKVYREILVNERIRLNRHLERYTVRSHIGMGQILSSARMFQEYLSSLSVDYERNNNVNHLQTSGPLPQFHFESPELRRLLDFILVDWDAPLYFMVRDQDGRKLLRRYAAEARAALEHYLSDSMNSLLFRHMIRGSWMLRAQYYFDGRRNDTLQYIPHRYNLDRGLYTVASMQFFYHRNSENFDARNPLFSDAVRIHSFLQSHPLKFWNHEEDDFYRRYEIQGMSSAEYFFEIHIDQFYRLIFFFNELNSRNFFDDETYLEPSPYGVISSSINTDLRQILYNNRVYGSYLLSLRESLRVSIANNKQLSVHIDDCLLSNRVHEENLIFQLNLFNATTTCTTTIHNSLSTTPKYDEPTKRAGTNLEDEGSPKRSRTSIIEEEQQYRFQNTDNYYGYTMFSEDEAYIMIEGKFCNFDS